LIRDFGGAMILTGKALRLVPFTLRHHMTEVLRQAGILVVSSSAVIWVLMMTLAAEGSLEGHYILRQLGAADYTAIFTSTGEYSAHPSLFGWALAAKVGCGLVAELGSMRISDEIDALEVMGVNSVVYLVATRVWAALITMIPLYLAALFASYLASELIVTKFFGLSPGTYQHYFQLYLPPIDIFYSFMKAMIFAVLVTFVHCYYGYNAGGGPAGVGVAAGRAIRLSIILVVVVNLILSLVLFGGVNVTARLVG
jgi:phospholipid/cholesterol/gamma-HCH transport system permease protein